MASGLAEQWLGRRVGRRFTLEAVASKTAALFEASDAEGRACLVTLCAPEGPVDPAAITGRIQSLDSAHLRPVVDVDFDSELRRLYVVHRGSESFRLTDLIADSAPLDANVAAKLGLQLARALDALHQGDLVHGALSPDVVLLHATPEGDLVAQIAGFCAAPLDATAIYTAPEFAGDETSLSASGDIWAAGVMLYEALTGAAPDYGTATPAALRKALTEQDAPSLRRQAPWLDAACVSIVETALSRDSVARYRSAAALAEALKAYLGADERLNANSISLLEDKRQLGSARTMPQQPISAANTDKGEQVTVSDAPGAERRKLATAESVPEGDAPTQPPADSLRHLLGKTLDGRFRLLKLLGEGGMGAVFAARTPKGEAVAVKVIRPDTKIKDAVRRFAREAQSAMRIDSPHVVKVSEVSTDGAYPYMVMELLTGRDLSATLASTGALEPSVAARIFVDASAGLAAAHACGVVHRDIKPSNIFLHEADDGTLCVKICDFGVVKQDTLSGEQSTALTHTGGILGTPAYMSPEQAQDSKSVDARTDIWSLCMSLYTALAGQPAWHEHKNIGEIMVALYTKDAPPLQDSAPWIPPDLATVVHEGLTRNRETRLGTAEELRNKLEAFASPQPLRAQSLHGVGAEERKQIAKRAVLPTISTDGSRARSGSRRRVLASIAAVVGLVGGGLALRSLSSSEATQPVAPATPCQSARDCSERLGQAARCRPDGVCAALATKQCKVEAEKSAVDSDNTVWIGTMFPADHKDSYVASFGRAAHNAVTLAAREIMSVSGGLPPSGKGETRPIGVVACNDAKDALSAAKHLVETVGVPAIIGFGSSKNVVELSSSLFIKNDVLVIPALNSSALISSIPHPEGSPRLVWRTAANTATRSRALAKVVPGFVEPRIRKALQAPKRRALKVGLCLRHRSAGIALSADLTARLRFNDKTVAENGRNFREFRLLGKEEGIIRDELTVADIVDFQPHVLILQDVDDAVIRKVVAPTEERWPEDSKHRPVYVLAASLEAGALTEVIDKRPSVAERLFGITTPTNTPANLSFTRNYNAAFGEKLLPTESPGAPYDSFYMLTYALIASSAEPLRGTSLAGGIEKLLPSGESIDVGPIGFLKALKILQRGDTIDLNGSFSMMDFDPATGESASDYALLCARRAGKEVQFLESGLLYDTAKDALTGTFRCEP